MTGVTTIDGIDLFDQFGAFVTQGGYNGLVAYPPLKPVKVNNWKEEDGIEADLSEPVLDSKEFAMSFAAFGAENLGIRSLITKLSDGASHTFAFNEIGKTVSLRMTGQQSMECASNMDAFTLTFCDDKPLDGYVYQAPTGSTIPQDEYAMDLVQLRQYGIIVLQGTDAEILKSPKVKKNLTQTFSKLPGAIYDPEVVNFESKEVTLGLVMIADSLQDFWRNYNAFLYDLTKPGARSLFAKGITYDFYYKKAIVQKFDPVGQVWCQFSVTVEFLNHRLQANIIK